MQPSALEKHFALFYLVIRFWRLLRSRGLDLPGEYQETLGEVSEILLPLREDHPEPEMISSKPRTAFHLVAQAQDGNAHPPGEERIAS